MRKLGILGCCALLVAPLLHADEQSQSFESGERRVALVELFTSEGCSSCPPADRWLSDLKNDPNLFTKFVPLAFHVDYWDYIGWKDDFARPEFSTRQRRYIDEGAANVVYTPGLFKDGKEWRTRRNVDIVTDESDVVGSLAINVAGGKFDGQFDSASSDRGDLLLHVAILGMNLETQVQAGENRGKTLYHDFVVVGFSSIELEYDDGIYAAAGKLPETFVIANDLAVVAWVSNGKQQAPLQAVGGFIQGT